jgi:hypothetical protein
MLHVSVIRITSWYQTYTSNPSLPITLTHTLAQSPTTDSSSMREALGTGWRDGKAWSMGWKRLVDNLPSF